MKHRGLLYFIIAASVAFAGLGNSDERHHQKVQTSSAPELHLSEDLKQVLIQEMVALQNSMQALIPVIVTGNWHEVAEIGRKIHDSHIMKQKLSESQLEALHHSLPARFSELDHRVHHSAAMLAHAAEMKNSELVSFYFYKVTEACIACHSKYASHRFPGLAPGLKNEEHH